MDKIIFTRTFFESFEREANQEAVKYTPYREKVDEVMSFKWSLDSRNMLNGVIYLKDE